MAERASKQTKRKSSKPAAAPKRARRTVILVAGMHRSGTSAATRVLNLAGGALPENLMGPAPDNETGFWEPLDIVEAHDQLLAAFNTRYDTLARLPEGYEKSEAADALIEQIRGVIESVPGRNPVVIKDPRLSRLLPVWRRAAKEIGLTLKLVVMSRNPIEVAHSLEKRSNFSYEKSLLLWLLYNIEVEAGSRGLSRTFVGYDKLMSDWRGELARVRSALRLSTLKADDDQAAQIDSFLSEDLHHHRVSEEELEGDRRANPWVRRMHEALTLAAAGETQKAQTLLDALHADATPAINVLGETIDAKDAQIFQIASQLAGLSAERERLAHETEELTAALDQDRQALSDARQARASLEGELLAEREDAARASQRIDEEREALENALQAAVDARSELEDKVSALTSELAQSRAENEDMHASLKSLQDVQSGLGNERAELDGLVAELRARLAEYETRLEEDGASRIKLESELERAREEAAGFQEEWRRALAQSEDMAGEAERALQHADRLSSALFASQERYFSLKSEASREAQKVEDLSARLEALEEEGKAARDEAAEFRGKSEYLQESLAAAREELNRLRTDQEEARKAVETARLEAEKARLEAAQKDELHAARTDKLEAQIKAADQTAQRLQLETERVKAEKDAMRLTQDQVLGEMAQIQQAGERVRQDFERERQALEALRVENANYELANSALSGEVAAERERALQTTQRYQMELDERLEWERRAEWLAAQNAQRGGLKRKLMAGGGVSRSLALMTGVYSPALLRRPRKLRQLVHQSEVVRASGLFDEDYYLQNNWDVRVAGEDPILHYLMNGAADGRNPGPAFDTKLYETLYPDVQESGLNPLYHFIRYGQGEGRVASHADLPPLPSDLPQMEVRDRYAIRPDEIIGPVVAAGEDYLNRFSLLTEAPNFAGAVDELRRMDREIDLAAPDGKVDVSIIIPVYGQLAYTLNCLHSLLMQKSRYRCEIIVVDDRSPDDTYVHLARLSWMRCLSQAENGGFIASCNAGAAESRGDHVVFLNNDTRVAPGWLDELIGTFEQFPETGLAGSKLFYPDGTLQEAGGLIWRDGSAWNYGRNQDPNRPEFCYARQVDYISGASIAVRRSLWNALGGFDGDTYERAYCEDSDLAFRVRASGSQTWFQPLSRVVHYEGKTSGTDVTTGEKAYQVSNMQRFQERWRDTLLAQNPEPGTSPYIAADRGPSKIALVLDALSPEPWRDAGSVTVVNTIRALQQLGYRVVFAPQDNLLFIRESAEKLMRMGVEVLYLPYTESISAYLEAHADQVELVHLFRYGVVNAEIENIRRLAPHAMTTFNVMDLHHVRVRRQAEIAGDSDLLRRADGEIRRDEMHAVMSVDTTFVHTVPERSIVLRERPNANVRLYPYVVDEFGRDAGFVPRSDVCFLGGFNHTPNVDAAEFFARDVMPHLRRLLPGVRFHIAGANVNGQIKALEAPDVVIDGFVPSLREYFARFRVMVAPLRYGAGIKGKVAAALVHGVPSVVSNIAAEGMELEDGVQAFIRDDPQAIAEAVAGIYGERAKWEAMSDAAMAFALENYTLDAACRAFEDAISAHGAKTPIPTPA